MKSLSLTTSADAANDNLLKIQWAASGKDFQPNHGELAGILTARDEIIPAQQQGLDDLAVELAYQVNTVHLSGYGLDGSTGLNFFSGTDALSLRVNSNITVNNIAAAAQNGAAGDGSVAQQIAAIQSNRSMNGGTATLNSFYNTQITQLGVEVQRAQINAHNQSLVQGAMDTQRELVGGVNLDEEAANLAKFQRAYEAAARVMTTYDEMLDRVINGMGIVGR